MLLLIHLLGSQNMIVRLRMFLFELSVMLHITNAIFLISYILLHMHFVYFNFSYMHIISTVSIRLT